MNDAIATGWYVLLTEQHRERRAELALIELGFDAYVPVETRWAHHARTKRAVTRPLLPRYIFVRIEAQIPNAFRMILEADGIDSFVQFGERPRPIAKASWIGEMKQAQTEGAFDLTRPSDAPPLPVEGAKVQITGSSYMGYLGTVVRMEPKERVRVLFQFMGREVEHVVPVKQVRAA